MNKYIRFLTDSKYRFDILASRGLLNFMSDERFLKRKYQLVFQRKLDLDNPQTYNEKLQWLKLNDRNPLYTTLVDKYAVRQYIANTIGEDYLIPLVGGPWKSFDEIDFGNLPNQFVLKCTHDSGGIVICRDKSKLNIEVAQDKLTRNLSRKYYYHGREWPYKNVPPRIIAEKYMVDDSGNDLRDYKFFCFDGKVKAMYIATDRAKEDVETKFDFFDMEFNHLPFTNGHPNATITPNCPASFEKMKELAAKLSKGMPHVRVDLYDINGKVYFGEFTFFHLSGFVPFNPEEWDYTFGDWIKLPDKRGKV
jgi:hypothetical protein